MTAIGLLLLALMLLWLFDKVILYATARSYIDEIASTFNLNRHLAEAISLTVFAIMVVLAAKTLSTNRESRRIGILGFLCLLVANSLVLWQGTKGQYFDKVGASTKCYVLTREGKVKYLEREGVDPETGRTCRPYTADMLERLRSYENGKRPQRVTADEPVFFEPRTGEPVIWFAQSKAGEIELFDLMGFQPDTGVELQPITREIADAYKAQAVERNRRAPNRVDIASYAPFDPVTGKPRVWYWQSASGGYEFYDNRGFQPSTGEELTLITREALDEYTKRSAQRCYVITKDSVRYGVQAGIDPATGRACRQLTAGILERVREYEKGNRPKPVIGESPVFFDLRSGDPALWYSKDSKGNIRLFDLMGFDPLTGDELQPVTKDVPDKWREQLARQKAAAERKQRPPQLVDPSAFSFFDAATGQAKVWYWRSPTGEYEFYDNEGFHPRTGEPLTLITREAIDQWRRDSNAAEQRRRDGALREQQERERAAAQERQEAQAGAICDQLAANPTDGRKPQNVEGVHYDALKASAVQAVDACRVATERFPTELRYQYQYARALSIASPEKAMGMFRQLARQGYPAAYDNLGNLLLRNKDVQGAINAFKAGVRLDDADSMVSMADLVERGFVPSPNPEAAKFALLSRAAQLGHPGAQIAAEEQKQRMEQAQQDRITQQQQQQMMLNLFGSILRGVAH